MADSPIEKIHIDEFLTLVEDLEVYQSLHKILLSQTFGRKPILD